MAVAVLTPRNNDLESGTWTRAAPLTSLRITREGISEKEKTQRFFASNYDQAKVRKTLRIIFRLIPDCSIRAVFD